MISVVIPTFRNAASALDLVQSLQQQELPPKCPLEIIVVDDGSGDSSTGLLRQCESNQVHVVALPRNMGRSVARNSGAEQALGKFLVFIDCDCRPADQHFLAAHLRMLNNGCTTTCGPVTGDGHGFWSRYQSDASARRARQHTRGTDAAGSSQNFAVHAEAFRQSGGFDTRYTEYGFEDRDLFVRLSRLGQVGWCTDAVVKHLDPLTLQSVSDKMRRAAEQSALQFSRDHAEAYRQLGYAALDVRLHRWLRPLCILLTPVLRAVPAVDHLLARAWLPFLIAKPVVKLLVALSYMRGTMSMRRDAAE